MLSLGAHYCLGALDDDGELTQVGTVMSEYPLDPEMAKMLVASPNFKCSNEILSISAMMSVPNPFIRPRDQQKQADEAKVRWRRCKLTLTVC